MYELDHAKDQLMTLLKLGLANLGMWARDQYFGESYQHCRGPRLLPFFKLGGWGSGLGANATGRWRKRGESRSSCVNCAKGSLPVMIPHDRCDPMGTRTRAKGMPLLYINTAIFLRLR